MLVGGVRIPGDNLGEHERAWVCAGNAVIVDATGVEPLLLAVRGETLVLSLPSAVMATPLLRELAFGWAAGELCRREIGWLNYVGRIAHYARSWETTTAVALLLLLDANRDGLPDLLTLLLR